MRLRRFVLLAFGGVVACSAPAQTVPTSQATAVPVPQQTATAGTGIALVSPVPLPHGLDAPPAGSTSSAPVPPTPAPALPSVDPPGPFVRFDVPQGQGTTLERSGPGDLKLVVSAATAEGTHHEFTVGAGTRSSGFRIQAANGLGVPCRPAPATMGQHSVPLRRHLAQASTRVVGSTEQFWVNTSDFQFAGDRLQTCVLKIVTPELYVYLDQAATPSAAAHLQALADAFTASKARDEAAFGAPPGVGPDGESRVYLVISPAVNNFGKATGHEGYFWSVDLIPGQQNSNNKRVVFVCDDVFRYPSVVANGVLAHEYQHLISFTRKTAANGNKALSEESWLGEGIAVYAQEVAGYGLGAGDRFVGYDIAVYEANPGDYGLLDWIGNPTLAFGQSYLFVRYLVDRFGTTILHELVDNPQIGVANVETVLAKRSTNFTQVFRDWSLANYLNGTPLATGTPYHYNNFDLAGNIDTFQMPGFKFESGTSAFKGQLRPWGSRAYRVPGAGPWHLNLAGSPTTRLIGGAF
jgi:hypothetical protein